MSSKKNLSPEEVEIDAKTERLTTLENLLMQLEMEFNSLQAGIFSFQRRYTNLVIKRMYELDKVEVEIIQYLISTDPSNPEYRQKLNKLKEQVAEAEATFTKDKKTNSKGDFKPSDSLKNLYRDVAKKVHPDLSVDDKERKKRTKLMAEVNEAYQNGDEKRLRQILSEWQYAPENVQGEDVGAQLVKVIRKIAQVQKRIAAIESEMDVLKGAEIYALMEKVKDSEKEGMDLLIQMSGYLDVQIDERKKYLDFLKNGGEE
jgi:hypothetical protein